MYAQLPKEPDKQRTSFPHSIITEDEKMGFLHHQLDSLGTQTPILDGLVLLGPGGYERLQGGALQTVGS